MKIVSVCQNKPKTQTEISRSNCAVSFGSGLTAKLRGEMLNADIVKISNQFSKKGTEVDFKDNKVIAWCCEQAANIFEQLNKRYNFRLVMPRGIIVEDFQDLKLDNPNMYGFCNWLPTRIYKNTNNIVPEKTLFFNSFESVHDQIPPKIRWERNWENIDNISDYKFENGSLSTSNFLGIFLHEFSHLAHEEMLLNKFNGSKLAKNLEQTKNLKQIDEFQKRYASKLSDICVYAKTDPFEAIACHMSKIIADCIDNETLMPKTNPFLSSPYEDLTISQKIKFFNKKRKNDLSLEEILRNFWNGKFS